MLYILNPLNHLRVVRRWANLNGAQVHLSASSWSLTLTWGAQVQHLTPRFVTQREGRLCYVRAFEETGAFAGWHPPEPGTWLLASDKLAFKRQASAMGLRVPAGWKGTEPLAQDFLVKNRRGSFGWAIDGPFDARTREDAQALPGESYCEQFVTGRSAKAWCWNGRVLALELLEPPYLVGDGVRSLEALAAPRGNVGRALPLDQAAAMLAWQGLSGASVPALGQKVLLDFRYATPFDAPVSENRNVWPVQNEPVRHQFAKAAALLGDCMPVQLRRRQPYTLDAALDEHGRAWFLEMNSHPMIHPDVYEPMLETLMSCPASDPRLPESAELSNLESDAN